MAMRLKTLIVDDEPLARRRLRKLLADEDDVEIVGECGSAREAIEAIERTTPHLVFLDVQLPDMDGFQLLEALRVPVLPRIIFVTAHDEHALRAFEFHAFDYLLKPYSRERLARALEPARSQVSRDGLAMSDHELLGLSAELHAGREPTAATMNSERERLVIKSDGRMFFVRPSDIDWVEASANYVRLHTRGESYVLRESMKHMESRLPPRDFMRIHRSAIVNLDHVRELQPWFHGEYIVILNDGTKLTASRAYAPRLRQLIG